MAGRSLSIALLTGMLCAHHAFAQSGVASATGTTTVTGPKSKVSASFNATQTRPTADSSTSSTSAGAGNIGILASAIDAQLAGLHRRIAAVLAGAGVTPERYDELTRPLRSSTTNLLTGLDAVRGAYEKTLRGFYGLLLDNTKELRKTLEDGNTVIRNIRTLRNATCDPPSFSPPTATPARITGWAGAFTLSSGTCTLTREPGPLQLDYVLTCTEPGASMTTRPPRYTSRFVSAATASTEECRVTRRYGVESTTTITLLDPAAFFAAAAQPAAGGDAVGGDAAEPDVEAASGLNKAAAWYKGMFPVDGKPGQRFSFVPAGVAAAVASALKEVKIDSKVNLNPFTAKTSLQDVAESITAILEQRLKVGEKIVKIHKEAREHLLSPEILAQMKGLSFKNNLRESMGAINISSLFDGIFAQKASSLLARTPLAGQVGSGRAAAAAAAAASQFAGEHPLRTLLAKARQGAGEPVALKLHGNLEQALNAASTFRQAVGEAARPGSVMELLKKDPKVGASLKQVADVLQQATDALQSGKLGKLGNLGKLG